MDSLVDQAWRLEGALLSPSVRTSRDDLVSLLADDFYEIGQSGRRWTRDQIIAALADETPPVTAPILADREARTVGEDIVLLSYRLEFGDRQSRRTSLWRRQGSSVQCIFHQGTALA